MARAAVRNASKEPPPAESVVTITEKTVTSRPEPPHTEERPRPVKPPLDEFIRSINVSEIGDYSFYLYRENELVKIREGYQYLQRIEAQDLNDFNLAEFSASLQEWTRKKFGGSRYQLRVNYRKTGEGLYVENFIIEGAPILSSREVVIGAPPTPAVPAVSAADEQLRRVIAESVERQLQGGGNVNPTQVVTQVIQMMQDANKAAMEIATKQAPAAPAAVDPMTQLVSILTALKTMGVIGAEKAAPTIREMVEEMRALGLVPALGSNATPQNPVTVAIELLKGIKELRGLGEESGLSEGGPEPSGLVELAKAIPSALEKLPAVLSQIREMRGPAAAPQPTLTGATRPAAPVMTPAPAGAPTSVAAGSPPQAPMPANPGEMLGEYIRTRIVELFQDNTPGDAVAEWLDMSQPNFAGQLGARSPEILIGSVIPKDPILQVMAGDPRLPKFVAAFLDYFKPEAAPGGPVPVGKKAN